MLEEVSKKFKENIFSGINYAVVLRGKLFYKTGQTCFNTLFTGNKISNLFLYVGNFGETSREVHKRIFKTKRFKKYVTSISKDGNVYEINTSLSINEVYFILCILRRYKEYPNSYQVFLDALRISNNVTFAVFCSLGVQYPSAYTASNWYNGSSGHSYLNFRKPLASMWITKSTRKAVSNGKPISEEAYRGIAFNLVYEKIEPKCPYSYGGSSSSESDAKILNALKTIKTCKEALTFLWIIWKNLKYKGKEVCAE